MTQVIYVGVGADTINVCTTKLSRTPLLREAMEMCNDILTRILPWNGGRSIGRFTLAFHAKEKKEKAMDAGTEAQKHVPSLSFSSTTYPADIYMEMGKKAMEKTQKISDQGEEEASTKSNNKNNMYPFVTPVRGTIKRRIFACFLCNLKLACRRTLQAISPQKEDI